MRNLLLLLLLFIVGGCDVENQGPEKPGTPDNPGGETEEPTKDYWSDDAAKRGLQLNSEEISLFLGEKEYYATGVNCYDLFLSGIIKNGDVYEFNTSIPFEILKTLKRQGVTVLRFSCIQYYAEDFVCYVDNKRAYLQLLTDIAERAQQLKIGIIPSLFWQHNSVCKYFNEPTRAWGRSESKTSEFIKSYTKDIVTTLARYKSVFAWELGNELNLGADLPNWQEAFATTDPQYWLKGSDVAYAAKVFVESVQANDPAGRVIFSGHANLRNSQYNQYANNSWGTDSREQYKQITEILTPNGMDVSEHIYEFSRTFSDVGEMHLLERLQFAKSTAKKLGKSYFVGEFGGKDFEGDKTYYDALHRAGIQLSLVWNFSASGLIEHSFTEESEKGQYIFELIRTCNKKFDETYK